MQPSATNFSRQHETSDPTGNQRIWKLPPSTRRQVHLIREIPLVEQILGYMHRSVRIESSTVTRLTCKPLKEPIGSLFHPRGSKSVDASERVADQLLRTVCVATFSSREQ